MNLLRSLFDELRVVERTPIIEQKSIYGLSALRDITIGNVTSDGEEFALACAGGVDRAVLDTAERGPYAPGQELEPGAALRIPARLTGTQVVRVGYYDDDDGWFYEYDATGLHLCLRKGGVDTRQLWGRWQADNVTIQKGTVLRERVLPSDGHVHQIALTWYGFGPAEYSLQNTSRQATGWMHHMGTIRPVGGTSTSNPHLPLRAEVITGVGDAPITAYVSGRQVNMVGKYKPIFRPTSLEVASTAITATGWTSLFAVRRRAIKPYALTKMEALEVIADVDVRLALLLNPTIPDPANWNAGGITDVPITETLLQENLAPGAIDITTADWVQKVRIAAGGQGNRTGGEAVSLLRVPLIEDMPFAVLARGVGASGNISVTAQMREDY